jgi:hypothetical protein
MTEEEQLRRLTQASIARDKMFYEMQMLELSSYPFGRYAPLVVGISLVGCLGLLMILLRAFL